MEDLKVKKEGVVKPYTEMESDELVYDEIYFMRKRAEILMRVIEQLMPDHLVYEISCYYRPSAVKRDYHSKDLSTKAKNFTQKSSANKQSSNFKENYNGTFSFSNRN